MKTIYFKNFEIFKYFHFYRQENLDVLSCDDWIGNVSYDIKGNNFGGNIFFFAAKLFKIHIVEMIKGEKVRIALRFLYQRLCIFHNKFWRMYSIKHFQRKIETKQGPGFMNILN